jgi:hypothetical protein
LAGAILMTIGLLARRSLSSGRADRRGAARLAGFVAVTQLTATLLVMAHASGLGEVALLANALAWPMIVAVATWWLFNALEPYIRLYTLDQVVAPLLGPTLPRGLYASDWLAAASLKETAAASLNSVDAAILERFMLLFLYCLIRRIVRRDGVAMIVFAGVLTGAIGPAFFASTITAEAPAIFLSLEGLMWAAVFAFMLVRFGLVTVVAQAVSMWLLNAVVTFDPSVWYSGPSLSNLIAVLAMAIYSASTCLAARGRSEAALTPRSRLAAV